MAIKITKSCQLLVYPMMHTTISGGFKNTAYRNKYGYQHYGIDCVELTAKDFEPVAEGEGVVLATEFNSNNSLGGIVVIRYNNVFCPRTGVIQDLIIRHYHLDTIYVKKGDKVTQYQKLGHVTYGHKWWNHIHVEIDKDVKHPFHTPQVAEISSNLLIRTGANDSTILNPAHIFVVGTAQTVIKHPNATLALTTDVSPYKERDYEIVQSVQTETAPQNLILPINECKITAGYQNKAYLEKFGFAHYGLDMIGSATVYGSGIGKVIACGLDSVLGNVIAIRYNKVVNHKTGEVCDIIARYNHLASIAVKVGQAITKDTKLGIMGNTGKYSTGIHLHFEVDKDSKEGNECYTPSLSSNSNIMKAGLRGSKDTTFNPAEILFCKTTKPDCQYISRVRDEFSCDDDIDVKKVQ